MASKDEQIRARAYQIWEKEGRPHGRHHDHWHAAATEYEGAAAPGVAHPGMMGDGTEEQNLGQAGNPGARITEAEVRQAFGGTPGGKPAASGKTGKR